MKYVIGAMLFIGAVIVQIRCIAIFSRMMDEVNACLLAANRVPEVGPSYLRGKVIDLHKQFFPDSRLRHQLYWWHSFGTILFLAAIGSVVRFVPRQGVSP